MFLEWENNRLYNKFCYNLYVISMYGFLQFSAFGIMRRESESYGRQDSGCPQSPVTCTLVTRDIRKNYKYLKREMSADILLDYLVQHSILETDENEFLIGKCRAVKCDFILRKLLRHPERIQDFSTLIAESKEQGFECFRTLGSSPLSSRPPATENQVLVGEGGLYTL